MLERELAALCEEAREEGADPGRWAELLRAFVRAGRGAEGEAFLEHLVEDRRDESTSRAAARARFAAGLGLGSRHAAPAWTEYGDAVFSPDGRSLAALGKDRGVLLLREDPARGWTELPRIPPPDPASRDEPRIAFVRTPVFTPDGAALLAVGYGGDLAATCLLLALDLDAARWSRARAPHGLELGPWGRCWMAPTGDGGRALEPLPPLPLRPGSALPDAPRFAAAGRGAVPSSLAPGPTGQRVAVLVRGGHSASSPDLRMEVHDLEGRAPPWSSPGLPAGVESIQWSPDGSRVLLVGADEGPLVLDLERGAWEALSDLPAPGVDHRRLDGQTTPLRFAWTDSGHALVARGDGLRVLEIPGGARRTAWRGNAHHAEATAPGRARMAATSASFSGVVELADRSLRGWREGHVEHVLRVAVDPDLGRAVSFSPFAREWRLWDLAGGRCLATRYLAEVPGPLVRTARRVALLGPDGLELRDPVTWELRERTPLGGEVDQVSLLDVDPSGERALLRRWGTLQARDLASGEVLWEHEEDGFSPGSTRFLGRGEEVLATDRERGSLGLLVLDAATGTLRSRADVSSLGDPAPDPVLPIPGRGAALVRAAEALHVVPWDAAEPVCLDARCDPTDPVAIHPGGHEAAHLPGGGGPVRRLDLATGAVIGEVPLAHAKPGPLAYLPGGDRLLVAGRGGLAFLSLAGGSPADPAPRAGA